MSECYWSAVRSTSLKRRRLLVGAAAGVAGLSLTAVGCGRKSTKPAGQSAGQSSLPQASGNPQTGGTLATAVGSNIAALDPQRALSYYTSTPMSAAYSRPFRFKSAPDPAIAEAHDIEPDLALSAESPDAITWTLKLRPDAKFHNIAPVNGHAVEAEDIKATFVRAVGPEIPFRGSLNMIDPNQIQTPDKSTVVFKLNFPFASFNVTLASPSYSWVLPREALAGSYDPNKAVIGSGPFIFDSYTPDVAAQFKRNPEWFGKPQPYADAVRWAIIPDASQQRAQFVGGNLDFLGTMGSTIISPLDVPALMRDVPKATVVKSNPAQGRLMFVQLGDPTSPFQDIRMRQALSLGFDRDTLAKVIYNNEAPKQWFVHLSMGKWAMTERDLPADAAQYYKYNPGMAKQLVEASGYANEQFKLVYITGFLGPEYEQTAQTVANMLNGAGLKVTAVAVDFTKDYVGGGKGIAFGNYDKNSIIFEGIGAYTDVDEYVFNQLDSKSPRLTSRLNDPAVNAMTDKARTILNADERLKAYMDIQKYVASKLYLIGGFPVPYLYTVAGPRVQNYCYGIAYGICTETLAKAWIKG